jgi:hypothetical protein
MNVKRYILTSLAVFVCVYLLEFLFHGMLMANSYMEHADLLRSSQEQLAYMPFMALGFVILAFGFTLIFIHGYEGKGVAEGLRFGLYTGIAFSVSTNLINYAVFPRPKLWVVCWIVGETLILMVAGALAAVLYKPRSA